jgi:hypothetical protein
MQLLTEECAAREWSKEDHRVEADQPQWYEYYRDQVLVVLIHESTKTCTGHGSLLSSEHQFRVRCRCEPGVLHKPTDIKIGFCGGWASMTFLTPEPIYLSGYRTINLRVKDTDEDGPGLREKTAFYDTRLL